MRDKLETVRAKPDTNTATLIRNDPSAW